MKIAGSKLTSAMALAVLLALASLPAFPAAGPRIHFDRTTFDFGSMYQEGSITHSFDLRNIGDAPLKIQKVTSSCGCTAALPSRQELLPGETAAIKVTFKSGRMRDRVSKHIYVDSSDPAEPRVTLTLSGVVKMEVEIIPSGLYLGNVRLGEALEREVLIRPAEVKKFRLFDPRADNQAVQVLSLVPIADKQGGYRLKVRFGPVTRPERVTAQVIVRANLPHCKELRIPVNARVVDQPTPPLPPQAP